jgi:hypothetical protein
MVDLTMGSVALWFALAIASGIIHYAVAAVLSKVFRKE